jgi:hypothetical protein
MGDLAFEAELVHRLDELASADVHDRLYDVHRGRRWPAAMGAVVLVGALIVGLLTWQRPTTPDGAADQMPSDLAVRATADAPLTPRSEAVAAWTGTSFIVWGGRDEQYAIEPVGRPDGAEYTVGEDRWSEIAPAPRPWEVGVDGVGLDGGLVVWGWRGEAVGWMYTPETDAWWPLPPAPFAADATSAGGLVGDGVAWFSGRDAALFDPSGWTWQTLPQVPARVGAVRSVAATGSTVLVWGEGGVGGLLDVAAGTWAMVSTPIEVVEPAIARTAQGWLVVGQDARSGDDVFVVCQLDDSGGWSQARFEGTRVRRPVVVVGVSSTVLLDETSAAPRELGDGALLPVPTTEDAPLRADPAVAVGGGVILVWGGRSSGSDSEPGRQLGDGMVVALGNG